jgi:hypothetical protein
MVEPLYLLNLVLLVRLPLIRCDRALRGRQLVWALVLQLAGLGVFVPSWSLAALAASVVGLDVAAWRQECRSDASLSGRRLMTLSVKVLVIAVLSSPAFGLKISPVWGRLTEHAAVYFATLTWVV